MYYPVFLNLQGKKCVIFGGGRVAFRKIKELINCNAQILVVSPNIIDEIRALKPQIIIDQYKKEYLKDAFLVFAATNNKTVNDKIAIDCKDKNILVNVASKSVQSEFINPCTKSVGDITICASTNGKFPKLAQKLCDKIDIKNYASKLDILEKYRKYVIDNKLDKTILDQFISDDILNYNDDKFEKELILRCKNEENN